MRSHTWRHWRRLSTTHDLEYLPFLIIREENDTIPRDHARAAILFNAGARVPFFTEHIVAGDCIDCNGTTFLRGTPLYVVEPGSDGVDLDVVERDGLNRMVSLQFVYVM